ncbi:MAG: lipoate--protein ligase family protein [Anaerolineae bacterium]|nr:lipoate--protein ligase family protein [Anaerolineae bacterium]MCX8066309.1 lipoate--protein ligase family protein [Anaerolineae bacterium]MDW7991104.1 lipoate--protein ligase family protein [Anaerolineae bacterium]
MDDSGALAPEGRKRGDVWRLIRSAPADGATQMAVDEAIWQSVASGLAPPTLRLYAWDPPCLSLGRNQSVMEVDREALARAGYDLVRRPTGGRAILHIDELTYSVALPLEHPLARGDVPSSCRRISEGLLAALRSLGVWNATAYQEKPATPVGPVCFETPGEFEIVVGGRKLIGSAQARGRGGLLQHGALPLFGDIARICAFLRPSPDPERVRARATTLSEALGREVSWDEAAEAVVVGFQQAFGLVLEERDLLPHETELALRLREEKYAAEVWTARL